MSACLVLVAIPALIQPPLLQALVPLVITARRGRVCRRSSPVHLEPSSRRSWRSSVTSALPARPANTASCQVKQTPPGPAKPGSYAAAGPESPLRMTPPIRSTALVPSVCTVWKGPRMAPSAPRAPPEITPELRLLKTAGRVKVAITATKLACPHQPSNATKATTVPRKRSLKCRNLDASSAHGDTTAPTVQLNRTAVRLASTSPTPKAKTATRVRQASTAQPTRPYPSRAPPITSAPRELSRHSSAQMGRTRSTTKRAWILRPNADPAMLDISAKEASWWTSVRLGTCATLEIRRRPQTAPTRPLANRAQWATTVPKELWRDSSARRGSLFQLWVQSRSNSAARVRPGRSVSPVNRSPRPVLSATSARTTKPDSPALSAPTQMSVVLPASPPASHALPGTGAITKVSTIYLGWKHFKVHLRPIVSYKSA